MTVSTAPGLTMTRYFTKDGVSPYSMVKWRKRTVQILNDKGAVIFKDEVDAPDFWSDTAIQIAASKYFCLDADGNRETSIRQMIERVVRQISLWGLEYGYFGPPAPTEITPAVFAAADIFADELRYILLHQMAAFNSPVWFNFGAKGHQPQSSACFILNVEDTMESILQAAADEAMIFKFGSGAGMNLSSLRSSKEELSSGGKASGPVSFMRGYDAWAGTIKSGGKTRRAALMMELDADHPDIAEFVRAKATEEYKAHLLLEMAGLVHLVHNVDEEVLDRVLARSAGAGVGPHDLPTLNVIDLLRTKRLIAPYLQEFVGDHNWTGFSDNTAYGTVGFQNMNTSVSLPHTFMRKVTGGDPDEEWFLLSRKTYAEDALPGEVSPGNRVEQGNVRYATVDGTTAMYIGCDGVYRKVMGSVNAVHLMHEIALAAWQCGDPGVQFVDTMNHWFTAKASGRIRGTNPCGEVDLPDDTSCNLASTRLTRFIGPDGKFDFVSFMHVVRTMAIAQDMLIDPSTYPTASIAENTRRYRALGLGIADIGTLLMRLGLPYDSQHGRDYAASIMSLLTATAYRTSREMAAILGPSAVFDDNAGHAADVLGLHAGQARVLADSATNGANAIAAAAFAVWNELMDAQTAPLRNMAVSCIAPTGTIGLLMDCQTTGIEPDFALVKYKRLVGGGVVPFVNEAVDDALKALGYPDEDRAMLIAYVEENGHLEDTGILKDEHLPVFDCAGQAPGATRTIAPLGHINMMAAVQPFVSMSISKTVNMPESATVQDIVDTYVTGWKLGLKAIALYRDRSKRLQPLVTSLTAGDVSAQFDLAYWEARAEELGVTSERRKLPDNCPTIRHKFSVGGHEGYLHCGMYDNGKLGEIFVRISKEGSTISGVIDAFATMFSIALQRGTPLEELARKFAFTRFEPSGWTGCRHIPKAESVVDYIVRWLAFQFLPREEAESLGVRFFDDEEEQRDQLVARTAALEGQPGARGQASRENTPGTKAVSMDAPPCPTCGETMVRNGACYKCVNCGATSGCS